MCTPSTHCQLNVSSNKGTVVHPQAALTLPQPMCICLYEMRPGRRHVKVCVRVSVRICGIAI
eukprot:7227629-Alexandrium_andersonii.AAC.1